MSMSCIAMLGCAGKPPQPAESPCSDDTQERYEHALALVSSGDASELRPVLARACDGGVIAACDDLGDAYLVGLGGEADTPANPVLTSRFDGYYQVVPPLTKNSDHIHTAKKG